MSTRSNIGILNSDKSVNLIYCHWDGYPSHNGKILLKHYTTTAKVRALLKLGDISSLAPEIGFKHDFDNHSDEIVTAYGRDRGEKGTKARKYMSTTVMFQQIEDSWTEYLYLWDVKHNKWLFAPLDGRPVLRTLTQKDCRRD